MKVRLWAGIRCQAGDVLRDWKRFVQSARMSRLPRAGVVSVDCLPEAEAMVHPCKQIAPGEIHLWLSFYDEIADERLLASYRDLLAEAEKGLQRRFYFAKDRHRYLVTRAMVRTVLSRYASIQSGRLDVFGRSPWSPRDCKCGNYQGTAIVQHLPHRWLDCFGGSQAPRVGRRCRKFPRSRGIDRYRRSFLLLPG